jgi:tetratricopeptide (TPR) repeat protein
MLKFSNTVVTTLLIWSSGLPLVLNRDIAQALPPAPVTRQLALSSTQVATIAEQISVRIDGQAPGTGILLSRQGQTYFVLTAAHVVATPDEYDVITPDGQKYKVNYAQVKKLPGVDLAVVPFTSARSYPLAKLGNSSQVQRGMPAFVAGWPTGGNAITNPTLLFQQGIVSANSQVTQADGYGLIYTNNTLPGMSGGPVLNSQGEVIGVHGKGETQRSQVTQNSNVVLKVGYNLGVPINTFLNLAPKAGINLPVATATPPRPAGATGTTNPPSPAPGSRIDDFIAMGGNKLNKGDYPGAIAAFDRAIALNPQAADAYRMRAAARISALNWSVDEVRSPRNRQEVQLAQADLDESIRLDPSSSEAFAARGFIRANLKNESGAMTDIEESLKLNPNNAPAYIVRSLLKYEKGDFQGTIADANTAIQRDPDSPYIHFAYNNRGVARARQKDFQGAMADLTRAIQLAPKNPHGYIVRGLIRGQLGDTEGGLKDVQQGADLAVEQNNSALHQQAIKAMQGLKMRQRLGI